MYGVDGGRTAKSAARRSKDVPGEFCKIDWNIGREKKIDGVARWIARVGHDLRDLLAVGDQAFGEEEASGQFIIMARCAHGDADRARFDLDFERLFGSDGVVGLRWFGLAGPAEDRPVFGAEGGAVFVNAPAVHCPRALRAIGRARARPDRKSSTAEIFAAKRRKRREEMKHERSCVSQK